MSALFGPKLTIDVVVDRDPPIYQAGEEINLQVNVSCKKDLKISDLTAVLKSEESYQVAVREMDATAGGKTENKHWESEEVEHDAVLLLEETELNKDTNETFEVILHVPPEAHPTCEDGRLMEYGWAVEVRAGRNLAFDIREEVEILIAGQLAENAAGVFGQSNEPEEASLELHLPGTNWAVGELMRGELVVQPKVDIDISGVRVELRIREAVPRDLPELQSRLTGRDTAVMNSHEEEVEAVEVADRQSLQAGARYAFPFEITIPEGYPPSAGTPHGLCRWYLYGVLDRPFRKDTSAGVQLDVV